MAVTNRVLRIDVSQTLADLDEVLDKLGKVQGAKGASVPANLDALVEAKVAATLQQLIATARSG